MSELSLPLGSPEAGLLARIASSLRSVRGARDTQRPRKLSWPLPAGYRSGEQPDSSPDKAVIYLLDGQVLHGHIEHFRPGSTGLKIRIQLTGDSAAIPLSRVKKITLPDPVSMVEDSGQAAERLRFGTVVEFHIQFSDQEIWEAETKGSVQDASGTFLYTTVGQHSRFTGNARQKVIRHFVPASAAPILRIGAQRAQCQGAVKRTGTRPVPSADLSRANRASGSSGSFELREPEELETLCKGQSHAPRLGDALVKSGLISEQDLLEALKIQAQSGMQRRIGSILVENFGLREEVIQRVLLRQAGIPHVRLGQLRARNETVARISRVISLARGCAVLHETATSAYLAMSNPLDEETVQTCRFLLQKRIEIVVADKDDITAFLGRHQIRQVAGLAPRDFFN